MSPTVCCPGASEAYERLRTHKLTGTAAPRPSGFIWLLRGGIAGWMTEQAKDSASNAPAAAFAAGPVAPNLPDEILHGVVHVMADMALVARRETSP